MKYKEMSEEDQDDKFYSQIIYRSRNEVDLQDVLNKKGRSKSPRLLPSWSPEISYEQRIRRKKAREDKYVKKIYPEERPILLVKKKHVYKNLGNPVVIGRAPDEDPTFKITKNTEILDDVDEDIIENERNIRRFTMIHDRKKGRDPSPTNKSIYKVEGVEYLPEGFLELDPLLFKNEFKFDSTILEKMFVEEQRRLKALRRKQYSEKNYLKRRDVTIYVIDQFKDKVVDFLDLWFEKYERRMNKRELLEVASRLNTTFENMRVLQDLYLKKKVLLHSTQMKEYFNRIMKTTVPIPNGTRMPEAVRRYLRKIKEYQNIKSKTMQDPLGNSRWKYNPKYLGKYQTTQNIYNRPHSATFKSTGLLKNRSRSPYKNNLTGNLGEKYKFGKTYNPKYRKSNGIPRKNKSKSKSKSKSKNKNKPISEENNSKTDTFFLLSKTNMNDPNISSPNSKVGKSVNGRLDKLMDEFSELLGKKSADPIAKFHRMDGSYSKTQGDILYNNKLDPSNRIGSSELLNQNLRSLTEKKENNMSEPINRLPSSDKKDTYARDNLKEAQRKFDEGEYALGHRMPDMATNGIYIFNNPTNN